MHTPSYETIADACDEICTVPAVIKSAQDWETVKQDFDGGFLGKAYICMFAADF